MSSSSSAAGRMVLRGAAARRVQRVPFDVDLEAANLGPLDRAATAEAVAAGRAAGFEAGYRDGYAAGAAAAEAQAQAAIEAHRAVLDQAIAALGQAARQMQTRAAVEVHRIEDQLAAAAIAIAEAVIGHEIAVAENPGHDAIARALAIAPPGPATVRLHPADAETATGDFGRELTVVADPAVQAGGCILEVGACTIDAQIGAALDRVREALQ